MDMMNLTKVSNFKAMRESSYERNGGNYDALPLKKGETYTIANLEGPGVVKHIWVTIDSFTGEKHQEYYLRKILLKVYWDDEEEPSILCPIGDFFGLCHGRSYTYNSAFFTCSMNGFAGDSNTMHGVAMNCWMPMPFKKKARFEIVNEADDMRCFYYYIDWQKHESLSDDTLYLHAQWKRENPVKNIPDDSPEYKKMVEKEQNLTDKYNYLVLYAEGRGNFVGMNMSIDNRTGVWWGEGDDMFFIDREDGNENFGGTWPPDLHGTGSEDYLCQGWGMQHHHCLYYGEPWCETGIDNHRHHNEGKVAVYRYHVLDPIPFQNKIRFSIEHGHANNQEHDIASVAYWYQDEPHRSFSVLPVEERIPQESSLK